MIRKVLLVAALSLIGCSSNLVTLSKVSVSAIPAMSNSAPGDSPPAGTPVGDIYGFPYMAVCIVPTFFADAVTFEQLRADIDRKRNPRNPPRWYYIGSDTQNHYAIGFFFRAPRQVYKIARSECQVLTEFYLTGDDSLWLEFNSLEDRGVPRPCFIKTFTPSPFADWQNINGLKADMSGEGEYQLYNVFVNPPTYVFWPEACHSTWLESE